MDKIITFQIPNLVHWVNAPNAKTDDQKSNPWTYMWEGEKENCCRLSSALHTYGSSMWSYQQIYVWIVIILGN